MSYYLPDDIITEILFRMPVKSVLRFQCVSKTWGSLISSPHFIATHLRFTRDNPKNPPFLFFSRYDEKVKKQLFTLHSSVDPFSDDEEIENERGFSEFPSDIIQLHCPNKRIDQVFSLVGSSNGLLCLAVHGNFGYDDDTYFLWNPSIRKVICLPHPETGYVLGSSTKPSLSRRRQFLNRLGFGYHCATDDYKLVRLVYLSFNTVSPIVEIYTLRTGAWRSVTNPCPHYDISESALPVFTNGAVHWLARASFYRSSFFNVIVSFNVGDETFDEIAVPTRLKRLLLLRMDVTVFDGCLALVPCNPYGWLTRRWASEYHSVWVMKKYGVAESWTKLFDIDVGQRLKRVIGFTKNGEVLVVKNESLFSYEPSSRRTSDLRVHGATETFYLDTYVESLVLLNATD